MNLFFSESSRVGWWRRGLLCGQQPVECGMNCILLTEHKARDWAARDNDVG